MASSSSRRRLQLRDTESLRMRSVLYDRTTGLPAYPLLFDALHADLENRRQLGVVHVEIADLALVESLYGWQVFDRILARVAGVLRDAVGGTLPGEARLAINGVAGDRFVAFVAEDEDGHEVDLAMLDRIDTGLRAALDRAFEGDAFAGLSPKLSFRTGYSLLSEDPFYRFERRVYAAVNDARTFSERREKRREASFGAELKRIIKNSDVSTVFQPVVDLASREVFGFEALSRGPKDSLFEMPGTMFAMSSRVGVSMALDRLCRDTALRQCKLVARRGKVFLNVLPETLDDPAWHAGDVGSLLEDAAIAPGDLVLEVSERAADHEIERFAEVFDRLRGSGFALALDDVGAGYATLATLERVRPEFVKIDSGMVRDVHRNLIKQELLASLVHIAGRIGAGVIAKGVESEDEAAALKRAGARYAQGFLFAGPEASPGGAKPSGAAS